MDFCDGFAWPIPQAFRDALRICRFRRGDTIYTDAEAYGEWGPPRCHAIKVVDESGLSEGEGEDSSRLFRSNWSSPCLLELSDLEAGTKSQLPTTHGRLFNAMWRGDLDLLSRDAEPPLDARDCLARLKDAAEHEDTGAQYMLVVDWSTDISLGRQRAVEETITDAEISAALPPEMGLEGVSPLVRILRVRYSGRKIEAFRDQLKEALWPPANPKPTITMNGKILPRTLENFMKKSGVTGRSVPSISNFGVFTRTKPRWGGDIISVSFMHGTPVPYYFRFNRTTLAQVKVSKSVVGYIESMVEDCPTHVFKKYANTSHDGIRDARSLDERLSVQRVENQELLRLARNSFDETSCKGRHANLQKWFVMNDLSTLAVELPVWMRPTDLVDFDIGNGLCGHIDLIRLEGDRIWIWDYKPKARKEKHAHLQVFLYAIMFALRTGIPMKRLGAGYFDESDVFEVRW